MTNQTITTTFSHATLAAWSTWDDRCLAYYRELVRAAGIVPDWFLPLLPRAVYGPDFDAKIMR